MRTKTRTASSLIILKWFLLVGFVTIIFSSAQKMYKPAFGGANNALSFDGTNDYVTFGDASALKLSTFTIETWFIRQGTGTTVSTGNGGITSAIPLVTKGRGEAENSNVDMNYFLGIDASTNVLAADFEEGAGGSSPGLNHPIFGQTVICNNIWYHAAVTYDGAKWQLFLNGQLEREVVVNQPPRSDSIQHAALGSAQNSTGTAAGFFNGSLDEVRIWNSARTAQQIRDNLDVEITAATGLVGRWGLNEGTGTTASDSSGNNVTGTLTNGPVWVAGTPFTVTTSTNGLDLGGSTYVTFGAAPGLNATNFTLEAWVKREGIGVGTSTGTGGLPDAVPLITKGRAQADGSNLDMNYFLGIDEATGVLVADFEDTATGGNHPISGNTALTLNTWYHVAVTYDGTNWQLYLNGNPDGSLAVGQTPRFDSIQHSAIGSALTSTGAASGFFDGVIDEVRIWNVARSQSEISSNANQEISSAPNLIGRWGFNQSCGTSVTGSAGTTPISGTITGANFAWVAGAPFNLGSSATVTFQQGINSYAGTSDTYLRGAQSSTPQGGNPEVEWDTNEGTTGQPQYGLVRFDNLFGSGSGQIPSGATIISATLSYTVFDTGDPANVNEVLVDWEQATATFDNFGGEPDVQPDEYGNSVGTASGSSNGVQTIDVTNSIQAWSSGTSTNRGWIFRPTAGDGVGFRSSEYTTASERPLLSVTYATGNQPPMVNAGSDQTIIHPAMANLSGTASDDGLPSGTLTTTWSQVSGPGTVTFGDPNALNTTASFSVIGIYVLRLTADDGALMSSDDVTITVNDNTVKVTFQQGVNGYTGTVDTYLRATQPTTPQGTNPEVEWDLEEGTGGGPQYSLVRFENLFGSGTGQVPSGVFITSATLSYTVFDTGDSANVNEVVAGVAWDQATATFNNFGGEPDVQPDEYGNSVGTASGNSNGLHTIDVTSSIQDWYAGTSTNNGWIFRPTAGDGVGFRSSEYTTVSERPVLSITYSTVQPNRAPDAPTLISPANGATGVSKNPTLTVDVSDPDGDPLTVTYYGRAVSSTPGADFTIIALPDTQYYSSELNGGTAAMFQTQTQWIVNERATRNIVFVTQLGDCVQNGDNGGNPVEWNNAEAAVSLLENPTTTGLAEGIPFGIAVGNHDQSPIGDPNGTTTFYNQYFGEARFLGRSYYGGHYGSNNDNHYQLFSASGLDFIIIHFEYDPSANPAVLAWANNLLQTHSNRRAIIVSHHIINTGNPATFGSQGQAIYDALKGNPNLFLMMNGHVSGEGQRQDTFNGNTVNSLLADYQSRANGGNGWLRILTFSPASNQIQVQTYSPTLSQFETDADSQFTLSYDMSGSGNNFSVIGTNNNVPGITNDSIVWNNLADNTSYEWYVTVSDGALTTTSPTWTFTTVGPTAGTDEISGRITTATGLPLADATVALIGPTGNTDSTRTDAKGRYKFPDVLVGHDYLITPSKQGYTFDPVNMLVNHQQADTDLNFTALAATVSRKSGDFDGDGITDLAVFRPSNSVWYVLNSADNQFIGRKWGIPNDVIAPADFDGDGRTDISVFRPSNGTWYRISSIDDTVSIVQFGLAGDRPVPSDYDGDGKADIAVFRPSDRTWYRLNSTDASFFATQFGLADDIPTMGDYDGDGKSDIAVWRPTDGIWYRLNSSDSSFSAVKFGVNEDKPVPADFDGDGRTDISVFRLSNSTWYRLDSSNGQFAAIKWGQVGDIPAPGDYDGDGKTDVAIFRPSTGIWYMLNSTQGMEVKHFGSNGDDPIASAYIP